jgi:hypothetical protein
MQLNHVEISVPAATLNEAFAADLDSLLETGFGWSSTLRTVAHPTRGPSIELGYRMSSGVQLILREAHAALQPGVEDHLGFAVDVETFARVFTACLHLSRKDRRLELLYLEGGQPLEIDLGDSTYRTFFVRFLLPFWFQFETQESKPS